MPLTNAQLAQHIGTAFSEFAASLAANEGREVGLGELLRLAKWYRLNGATGTLADRREAMSRFVRIVFRITEGRAATTGEHFFKQHWIEILVPGESGSVD